MTRPLVLAYYFPDWHQDPRNAAWFGSGWDEWRLLEAARPRFPGHRQPRVPEGGAFDESDPAAAAVQIALARDHGVDGFLVDFYWYADGPYLSGALDRGLLRADNRDDIRVALMWANHDLVDIFPLERRDADPRRLARGALDRTAFERMVEVVVDEYFGHPSYLSVEGRPWFSLYEIGTFIEGMGGVEGASDALRWFRDRVRQAGHPGLHLDAVIWGFGVLPGSVTVRDPEALVDELGFDSATSYVWIHHADLDLHDFPRGDVGRLQDEAFAEYERCARLLSVPIHPNVTVGWDASPRTAQDVAFERGRYPFTPVWDQTPEEFEGALRRAREFLVRHPSRQPVLTINAWNEWTEGSALLPDTQWGTGYLEAVARVFGAR